MRLDDWLARPNETPAPTEVVEDVSPYALVAYNALAVWRWFFVLCWCQPAAARAVAGVVGDGGASIVGFLFAVGVMAGAERAKSQERLLELAALSGLCCACRGTALAACPFAFAVDYSVGNVEAAAWRDVFRRLFCARSPSRDRVRLCLGARGNLVVRVVGHRAARGSGTCPCLSPGRRSSRRSRTGPHAARVMMALAIADSALVASSRSPSARSIMMPCASTNDVK